MPKPEVEALSRTKLKKLAKERLRDSKILLDSGNYSGAYYLCGYVIECGLKAVIAKNVRKNRLPAKDSNKCYVHDLESLVNIANLKANLDNYKRTDTAFAVNWSLTIEWNEASRYKIHNKRKANELYDAISSKDHGVLKWVEKLLVEYIEEGKKIVEQLDLDTRFRVTAALWYYASEPDEWRLLIASPYVGKHGERKSYELIQSVLTNSFQNSRLSLDMISLMKSTDPFFGLLRHFIKCDSLCGIRVTNSRVNSFLIEDAYIYRNI